MIIYKAVNKINGKIYVGQTVQPFKVRVASHKTFALNSKYCKSHFQRAVNKYGFESFEWSVIEHVKNYDDLDEREIYWISFYDSYKNGYNSTLGGQGACGNTSKKLSLEDVKEIKDKLILGERSSTLAKRFSVSVDSITKIANKTSWAYVQVTGFDKWSENTQREYSRRGSKLSIEKVKEIKKLLVEDRLTNSEIAKKYGLTPTAISAILQEKFYKDVIVKGFSKIKKNKSFDLEESTVKIIQAMAMDNKSNGEIIKKTGVNIQILRNILCGRYYKQYHTYDFKEYIKNRKKLQVKRFTQEQIVNIKELLINGKTQRSIADLYKVDPRIIQKIASQDNYKDIFVQGFNEWSENRVKRKYKKAS